MWKKLVAVLTIIIVFSFAVSMKVDNGLIAGEKDLIDWHSYDGTELNS